MLERGALPHVDFSSTTFNTRSCCAAPRSRARLVHRLRNAPADFSDVRFESDARLDKVGEMPATFSGQFHGVACFDQTEFRGAAFLDRMTCYGNLSLDRTRFDAAVAWRRECFGGLWCNDTVFGGRADVQGVEVHAGAPGWSGRPSRRRHRRPIGSLP